MKRRRENSPTFAKRVECVQLAGAFECPFAVESGSKLPALHTLRAIADIGKFAPNLRVGGL